MEQMEQMLPMSDVIPAALRRVSNISGEAFADPKNNRLIFQRSEERQETPEPRIRSWSCKVCEDTGLIPYAELRPFGDSHVEYRTNARCFCTTGDRWASMPVGQKSNGEPERYRTVPTYQEIFGFWPKERPKL